MRIVYYTSGTTGIGRLVHGIAIYNALVRRGLNPFFTILSSSPPDRAGILDRFNIQHIEIPKEDDTDLLTDNYRDSALYRALTALKPEILIVDRMWFTLYNIVDALSCKKIFISSQVIDRFFSLQLPDKTLRFKPEQYHQVIAIEPFTSAITMEQINPLIIRNKDEILEREVALQKLGFTGDRKVCFIGMNFREGYFQKLKEKYAYLEREGYDVIYSSNLEAEGIFPIADYYNAIELIISSATYNIFWESRFFNKEAVFEIVPVKFCDLNRRLRECMDYEFENNGADELVEILMNV